MPTINCTSLVLADIDYDCDAVSASVGVDKDLIIVDYDEFDKTATLLTREVDDTNANEGGLTAIELLTGATQHTFTGTDYSVVPTTTAEIKEDGNMSYVHSVLFTAYSKTAATRKVIEALGQKRVIAIVTERSTGLYEIFGIDQGLKLMTVEREYVGAQNSNFYQVTLQTPDIAVIRESTVGELAVAINTAV